MTWFLLSNSESDSDHRMSNSLPRQFMPSIYLVLALSDFSSEQKRCPASSDSHTNSQLLSGMA